MLSTQPSPGSPDERLDHAPVTALDDAALRQSRDSRFVLLRPRPAPSGYDGGGNVTSFPAEPATGEEPRDRHAPSDEPARPAAFRLLDDVKRFIPQILQDNDLLRRNLLDLKSQAEVEIEAAEQQAQEWKASAETLKGQVAAFETMVLELRAKLLRAEAALAVEKELSSKAGQDAAEAECLSKLFEDTVIQSFGVGTTFQDALARLEGPTG